MKSKEISPARRRNVVWIFGDQHRGQALGIHGDPNVHTPNIDRLASLGVDLVNAYSGYPLCCPARGSLLTGLHAHRCVRGHEFPMPDGIPTIGHILSTAGYDTAWFGKWHVDGFQESEGRAAFHTVPRERRGGFGTWLGYENNNSPWDSHIHGHLADGTEVPHERLPGFETDALTDQLIQFLNDRAGDDSPPFFAALSVQPPHNPYVAPEEWMRPHNPADIVLRPNVPNIPRITDQARRDLAGYAAMIENLDANLGRVRAALDRAGLTDSTDIMFFSDHGDLHGSHGQFRKTAPWEESVRIPMIFAGGTPYYENRCGILPHLVGLQDLLPTTLGLCGVEIPSGLDGRDFSGLLRKERLLPERPEAVLVQNITPTGHAYSVNLPWRAVITDDGWKLVCFEGVPWLMFNLNEDPFELANLAHDEAFAERRHMLLSCLRGLLEQSGDSFPLPES